MSRKISSSRIKRRELIQRQVRVKKRRLEVIANSNYPITDYWIMEHERKVKNAVEYLNELEEIEAIAFRGANIRSVTHETLEKMKAKADYCSISYDGDFCKIVEILNFPYEPLWLIYMAPVSSV